MEENKFKGIPMIDINSGEVIDIAYYRTSLQQETYKAKQEKEKIIGSSRIGFVWFLFNYGHILFEQEKLSPSTISRLFYVSTFCNYDGKLQCGNSLMTKKILKNKLGISDNSFTLFWKEMIEKNILVEDDDKTIKINNKYFLKGKIETSEQNRFIRVYTNFVRNIYESCNPRDHKILSYFFQLIPFVSYKSNILCTNPLEYNDELIKPLPVGECCDILGYDWKNGKRLIENMLHFQIDGNYLMVVGGHTLNVKKQLLFINSDLFFGSNKEDRLKAKQEFQKALLSSRGMESEIKYLEEDDI